MQVPIIGDLVQYGSFGLVCFFVGWLTVRVTKQLDRQNETAAKHNEALGRIVEANAKIVDHLDDLRCNYPRGGVQESERRVRSG